MEARFGSEMARQFSGVQSPISENHSDELASKGGQDTRRSESDNESREMDAMVEEVREMARMFDRELEFRIEDELDQPVVEVKDTQRDEVIRQIPSEQMLELARNMERIRGILFDETT